MRFYAMVGDGDSTRFLVGGRRDAMPREAMPGDDSRRCDSTRWLGQAMPDDAMRRHSKQNQDDDD